jgi:hypothetical protein
MQTGKVALIKYEELSTKLSRGSCRLAASTDVKRRAFGIGGLSKAQRLGFAVL